MGIWRCPGQDRRFWKPGDIYEEPCPHCGNLIEFWKDDVRVRCPNCKELVTNPKFDPGCAAWCSYASKCLGPLAVEFQRQPRVIRDRLEVELRKELADQKELVNRSVKAAMLAEKLAREEGADMIVTVAASLLHALASSGQKDAAEQIMIRAGIDQPVREEIMAIIAPAPGSPNIPDSPNSRVVAQAVAQANLQQQVSN